MTAELVCAATDPAWLDRRREGITATDIVTIAGLVIWDSPWALYHRKLGLLPEVEQSDRMWVGSMLQEAIADKWRSARWMLGSVLPGNLFRNRQRRWQLATPDYLACLSDTNEIDATLECKTADRYQKGWGADGSDEVPSSVRAQVLWQMDTLGVGTGHVAVVFLPSGEFRSYTIRHHKSHPAREMPPPEHAIACPVCREIDGLRDLGFGFWSRILRKDPPDLDGLEVTTDALRILHPAPFGLFPIDPALVDLYDAAVAMRRDGELYVRQAQNKIREVLGDAHEATVDGRVVFRRTIGKRAGYYVQPGETDTLRRIGKDKQDG